MGWFRIHPTPAQQRLVNTERDAHPDEHVRRKMLVLWLLPCGLTRDQAAAVRGRAAFDADELIQTFIVHHLLILCEVAYKLPDDFCSTHPTVPWTQIQGMRHILVHDYFRVDLDIVWNVVVNDLPALKGQLETILQGLGTTP